MTPAGTRFAVRAVPWPARAPRSLTAALLALAMAGPAFGQSVERLRESDQPLEINAEEGIEWNRNDKTYIARGNARAASGDVEVLADVLIAYYREPAEGERGQSEIYLLEATGNVQINSPEGSVYGDKGQYKLEDQVFVMTGDDLRLVSKGDIVTARDSLEYWEGQRKAVARGKAHAIHEDKQIKADVLTANFEEDAQGNLEVRRIDAVGNVEILTAKEYARGREGTYFVDREVATLSGDVKITQGENQLDGNYAEVDMVSGISRLLGAPPGSTTQPAQVRALVLPRAAKGERSGEDEETPAGAPATNGGGS
jgi:lipopolysaccharide export system protein LptA